MDTITIAAALGPLILEAGKAAVSRWIAPADFRPVTVEQYATMRQVDIEYFRAMNDAGGVNPSYRWVEAVTRLMRPSVAAIAMAVWAYQHGAGVADTAAVDNFAAAVGFWLFGDRSLFYVRKGSGR